MVQLIKPLPPISGTESNCNSLLRPADPQPSFTWIKLTIKTPELRQWRCSGVFIVTFEHISHLVLVFLLLTSSLYLPAG